MNLPNINENESENDDRSLRAVLEASLHNNDRSSLAFPLPSLPPKSTSSTNLGLSSRISTSAGITTSPRVSGIIRSSSNLQNNSSNESDIEELENYLESLSHVISSNQRRLKEKEDELMAHVQEGNSLTFALSFHQFAQNLAVSEQILSSNGLDAATELSSFNKQSINKKFSNESLLNKYATKAVQIGVSESWNSFKRKRMRNIHRGNSNTASSSTPSSQIQAKVHNLGQKILSFIEEEITLLSSVFLPIGTVGFLVHSLYHAEFEKELKAVLSLSSLSSPATPSPPSTISGTPPSASLSADQVTPPSTSNQDSNGDWNMWSQLCLSVRRDVGLFAKEVSRLCGMNSLDEFEVCFPLLPIFHEAALAASELLSDKITKVVAIHLEVERQAFNQARVYPTSHIPGRSTFRNYPSLVDSPLLFKRPLYLSPPIASSATSIIKELDDIVEFVASLEFRPLIDTFVRSILPAMITYINRLALASRDVPQANGVEFLYISINTAAALQERFEIYEFILAPAHHNVYFSPHHSSFTRAPPSPSLPKSRASLSPSHAAVDGHPLRPSTSSTLLAPAPAMIWECQKMIDVELHNQYEQLVSIISDTCCTCFFPNIDMNEWLDSRVFFGDSRPSHGIQMLLFYLQSQSRSLHNHLLHHSVEYVIANALQQCGELLVARYSSISPSRMRTTHFKLDITYLVASIQTLRSACGVWYAKLSISSICTSLISLMAVVIGPLDQVCSFLEQYMRAKKSFAQPPPTIATNTPSLEAVIPNFPTELWPGSEPSIRSEVFPLEDMQFLIEKHALLSAYQYNYTAILTNCCSEFPPSFLRQLIANRPELKDSVYPPLSDSDKELLKTLLEFLKPP